MVSSKKINRSLGLSRRYVAVGLLGLGFNPAFIQAGADSATPPHLPSAAVVANGCATGVMSGAEPEPEQLCVDEARGSSLLEFDPDRARKLDAAVGELVHGHDFVAMADLYQQLFAADKAAIELEAPAPGPVLSPHQVYQHALPSTFIVGKVYKCDKCPNWHLNTATGFLIDSERGLVVTNFHVVDLKPGDAETLAVADHESNVFAVREIIAANREHDLAIVRIDAESLPGALSLATNADVGSPAYILSHPGRRYYTFTEGIVSREFQSSWAGQTIPMISVTAEYAQGSSGGPILNDRGQVIGIVTRTSPITAHNDDGSPSYAQMIERRCVRVESLHQLLERELPPATQPVATPAVEVPSVSSSTTKPAS